MGCAGFRLVSGTAPKETSCQDSPPPHVGSWDPSTKKASRAAAHAAAAEALQQALLCGYGGEGALLAGGAARLGLPGADYPARLAGLLLGAAARLGVPLGAALEVGAGVGATAFQLAAGGFENVLGVEHDARAVAAAAAAQQAGVVSVARKVRGVAGCVWLGLECWGRACASLPSTPRPHQRRCAPAMLLPRYHRRTRATCAASWSWRYQAAPRHAPASPSARWTPAAW